MTYVLIWTIADQQYAVNLEAVESILLACAVTHLPSAPPYIMGAINIHGQVVPVLNMRQLLGLPLKDVEIQDHFILVYIHQKRSALFVDKVKDVKFCNAEDLIPAQEILPNTDAVEHVLKENGQIILLYNLDKLIPIQSLATDHSDFNNPI